MHFRTFYTFRGKVAKTPLDLSVLFCPPDVGSWLSDFSKSYTSHEVDFRILVSHFIPPRLSSIQIAPYHAGQGIANIADSVTIPPTTNVVGHD